MGQKVNPVGIRLGIVRKHNSTWYASPKNYANYLLSDLKVREYLFRRLKNASIRTVGRLALMRTQLLPRSVERQNPDSPVASTPAQSVAGLFGSTSMKRASARCHPGLWYSLINESLHAVSAAESRRRKFLLSMRERLGILERRFGHIDALFPKVRNRLFQESAGRAEYLKITGNADVVERGSHGVSDSVRGPFIRRGNWSILCQF